MKPVDRYKSVAGFRMAVKSKLNKISQNTGQDIRRLYRQTAYAQFLARLFLEDDISWVLKGGHALELRLQKSRATKDVDLAMKEIKSIHSNKEEKSSALRDLLLKKSQIDLGDYFEFNISQPVLSLDNAPYGGTRFRVEAMVDGKTFSKFLIDIGIGDAWIEPQDTLQLSSHLEELGLESFSVKAIPIEHHIAEKIHALTLPHEVSNSRVKDLVDLFLIFKFEKFSNEKVKECIKKTFTKRNTHEVPQELLLPDESWEKPFKDMIDSIDEKVEIQEAFQFVNQYFKSHLS